MPAPKLTHQRHRLLSTQIKWKWKMRAQILPILPQYSVESFEWTQGRGGSAPQIFLFRFATAMLKFSGRVIHRSKGVFKTFQQYITRTQIPKISVGKTKKNLQSFSRLVERTAMEKRQRFFFAMFSTSALKESRAYAYYWQRLLAMITWSIWWSSISKRPLPKLWILTTLSKKVIGMSARWV